MIENPILSKHISTTWIEHELKSLQPIWTHEINSAATEICFECNVLFTISYDELVKLTVFMLEHWTVINGHSIPKFSHTVYGKCSYLALVQLYDSLKKKIDADKCNLM